MMTRSILVLGNRHLQMSIDAIFSSMQTDVGTATIKILNDFALSIAGEEKCKTFCLKNVKWPAWMCTPVSKLFTNIYSPLHSKGIIIQDIPYMTRV